MLEVRGLVAGYGPFEVLRGVDLDVGEGEIVAVLGGQRRGQDDTEPRALGADRAARAAACGSAAKTSPARTTCASCAPD